jgi:hypothetical protein
MLRTIYVEKFQLLESYIKQLNKLLKRGKFQTLTLQKRQRIIHRMVRLQKSLALLSSYQQPVKRVLVVALIALGFAISPVAAQHNFQFKPKQVNPFGLTPTTPDWTMQAMADLDGDGDLDLMASGRDGNFVYHQNTGTAKSPSFSTGVPNPFGLPAGVGDFREPTLVDLDGDGDLDMVVAEYSGTYFYQNTGTKLAPTFTTPVFQPFGLTAPGSTFSVDFADMDKDGDLDAFMINDNITTVLNYFENTGSPTNSNFSNRQTNPFGLQITPFSLFLEVADMDKDGDFDVAIAVSYGGSIIYYENAGTQNSPSFLPFVANPFGIDVENIYTNFVHPTLIDINNDGDLDLFAGESSYTTIAGSTIINYQECNTAPTSRDSMATTLKNVDFLFSSTAFPFSDPDDTALVAIQIVSLPTKGILKLFGNAVSKEDIISALYIMNLTFSPETDSFKVDGTAYTTFDFRVMDQSMISSSTNTFSIFVEPPIFDQPVLALFPNPATDYLQIKINGLELHKTVALSILDVSGKLVYQEMVNSSELYNKTIATDELTNGLYFIIIETEQGLLRERFIKN